MTWPKLPRIGPAPLPARLLPSLSLGFTLTALAAEATFVRPPAPLNIPNGRLAYWNFDAPKFAAADGQEPLAVPDLPTTPGLDGPAPAFTRTNFPGPLTYRVARLAGPPRLALAGGLRFAYRHNWSSRLPQSGPGYGWGRGPEAWACLVEVADVRSGKPVPVLALSVDPEGTNLVVQARGRDGGWRTNFQAAITWLLQQPELRPRNDPLPWREIAFSYSSSNTLLVLNGNHAQDWATKAWLGPGVQLADTTDDLVITFGSDATGDHPAAGTLDEIETFDRPLAPPDLYHTRDAVVLSAAVSTTSPAVHLRWFDLSGGPVAVRRRAAGDAGWVVLTNRHSGLSFTDHDPALQPGQTYEYEVGPRTTLVSLQGPPVTRRGRVIVLVEQSVARDLAGELEQLRSDLVGDGWTVVQREAPRHDYNTWAKQAINPEYLENLQRIKQLIQSEYAAAPAETRAVFLIGHITIPYSGVGYEDGHFDMNGAWPADAWYGDMDGVWSDQVMNTGNNIANPIRRNVPGDGKLDPPNFRQYIATPGGTNGVELAVGRIDFARLPAFGRRSELERLRQYLQKAHRYRFKELRFGSGVRVGTYFYSPFSPIGRSLNQNALLIGSRLDGLGSISHGDAFQSAGPYLWAMQGGYGAYDTLHNARQAAIDQGVTPVTTAALAAGEIKPHVAFYLLKGSYFGDWNNYQNDLLKALLALPDSGLAAFWTYDTLWRFEPLGVGGTLGDGFVRTARGGVSTRATFQLGDPTLRAVVTAPPTGAAGRRRGGSVELRWEASPDAGAGYFVLRSTTGADGPFEPITAVPVTGTTFTDDNPPGGRKVYQVRAAQLVVTGAGSFTNLSQAVFVSVN